MASNEVGEKHAQWILGVRENVLEPDLPILDPHHRHFGDLRMREQSVFNFQGRQLVAPRFDDVDR